MEHSPLFFPLSISCLRCVLGSAVCVCVCVYVWISVCAGCRAIVLTDTAMQRYEVLSVLGAGTFGVVLKAVHRTSRRIVHIARASAELTDGVYMR